MAKTFANVSDASARDKLPLYFFAQRTLALQNEPPTPPPLNALGLPCHAVCLSWARLSGVATSKNVIAERAAVTCGENDGGDGGEDESGEDEGEGEAGEGEAGEGDDEGGGTVKAATVKKAADKLAHSSARADGQGKDKEKTLAQQIAPLTAKITEYINKHQDDAAQEELWRTNMKRDTMEGFKQQREAINKQGEAIRNEVREAIEKQREAIRNEVHEAIDKQR